MSSKKANEKAGGHQTMHGYAGVPGCVSSWCFLSGLSSSALTKACSCAHRLFFNYEISPLQVIHRETRQSLAHFLTSTCAIIGGILTMASLVDAFVYGQARRIKSGGQPSKTGLGFAAPGGKML